MPDIAASPGGVHIQRVVTAGTFDRPEGALTLENNTWVVGNDAECLVIDAGHDGRAIVKSIPREQADGQTLTVGDVELHVLHTPGHTPGSVCFHAPSLGVVLTGDTLFPGGPGATRHDYSDFDTIIDSVRRLFTLPEDTVVLPGHGDSTVIGAERPHL